MGKQNNYRIEDEFVLTLTKEVRNEMDFSLLSTTALYRKMQKTQVRQISKKKLFIAFQFCIKAQLSVQINLQFFIRLFRSGECVGRLTIATAEIF